MLVRSTRPEVQLCYPLIKLPLHSLQPRTLIRLFFMSDKKDIFASIRIKPIKGRRKKTPEEAPPCEWKGCTAKGNHPAPKGRGYEGEYFRFCLEHVRTYNKEYNSFRNMSEEQVEKFRIESITGHRPTKKMGTNAHSPRVKNVDASEWGMNGMRNVAQGMNDHLSGDFSEAEDLHGVFATDEDDVGGYVRPVRTMRRLERKNMEVLGFREPAEPEEIRKRFKQLVKECHPDLNGGVGNDDRLRDVIQAYNYLKQAGLCA